MRTCLQTFFKPAVYVLAHSLKRELSSTSIISGKKLNELSLAEQNDQKFGGHESLARRKARIVRLHQLW